MKATKHNLTEIQDKALQLVKKGTISREQRIYALWEYVSAREWVYIQRELENNNFLLRDCIGDLIGWG